MKVDLVHLIRRLMASYNIPVTQVQAPFDELKRFDNGLRQALDPMFEWDKFGQMILDLTNPKELLLVEDTFGLRFAFLRIEETEQTVYILGPWRATHIESKLSKEMERLLGSEAAQAIRQFYNGVSQVDETWIMPVIRTLASAAWPEGEFTVREAREPLPLNFKPDLRYFNEPEFKKEIPTEVLERRYAGESRFMEAVSRGDVDTAVGAWEGMTRIRIEGRFTDSLYEIKTMFVILNTLLRKSIESSMVHPYYIDRISTRYACRIQEMTAEDQYQLGVDMVREYCRYVQVYSLKEYSPLVQKVINHINLNLDSTLSLKSLAAMCFISPSYLSNLFKRETGETLIDYINGQRIRRACQLLVKTKRGVSDVAAQVGILDVNYFTKLFKKSQGQTPTQYRRQNR